MKRTKENWIVGHPQDRTDISGLRFFDGEDLHYQERKKAFQQTQKEWLDQHVQSKSHIQGDEQAEGRAWAFQIAQCDRMRGMLEDQIAQKIRKLEEETRDTNVELNRQRKQQEREERRRKLDEERCDYQHQTTIRTVPAYVNPFK